MHAAVSLALGQQLELRRTLLDDARGRFVQPLQRGQDLHVARRRGTSERQRDVDALRDVVRRAVDSVQQKLRRGFAEMEEREQIEAHPHLLRFVEARQQLSLPRAALLANRRHELHRALESRGSGAAEDFCPQLDDAPQEQQIPAQLPVVKAAKARA